MNDTYHWVLLELDAQRTKYVVGDYFKVGYNNVLDKVLVRERAMAIEEAVAETAAGHQTVEALVVSALRQPDPEGPLPQQPLVLPHGRHQLGVHRLRGVA